jgi:hypothetical protein
MLLQLFELHTHVPIGGMLETEALQTDGSYVSCDKKNSWAVQGQGESASTTNNCIVCIQSKGTFITNPHEWMSKKDSLNPHFINKNTMEKNIPLQEDKYCNMKLYQKLLEATSGNHNLHLTKNEEKLIKHDEVVFGVTKRPTL